MATITPNKGLTEPNFNDASWNTTLNTNFTQIDNALGQLVAINVTGIATTQTLTLAQYGGMSLYFTGALAANLIYQFPAGVAGQWVIQNNTTGAYTLTLASAGGGASVTITQGETRSVYCDGTKVIYADQQTVAATANQILYGTGSGVTTSSGLTYNGTSLFTNLAGCTGLPLSTGVTGTLPVTNLPYTPVQQGGGASQGNNKVYIGWGTGGDGLRAQVDTTDQGRIWTDSIAPSNIAANGYQKLPSGLILQWASFSTTIGGNVNGSWPINFPNAIFIAQFQELVSGGTGWILRLASYSTTGFAGSWDYFNQAGSGNAITVNVFAIGH